MELWELAAREQIRVTLARYNHNGDRGRVTQLAEQFAPDGVLEISGGPTYEGREAIEAGLGGGVEERIAGAGDGPKPIVRHHVSSVLIEDVTPEEAHAASYFAVMSRDGLDHWGRYRDTLKVVDGEWKIAHRYVRVDARVEGSWAPAPR